MDKEYDFVIIGAGLAGLAAARELEKFERKVLIIERTDRAGGRLKTDQKDGYRLDRGFQVLLTEYPEAREILDYEALRLKSFRHGALCFSNSDKFEVSDLHRNKLALAKMIFSPVGGVIDKLKVGNLAARLRQSSLEDIFSRPEHRSDDYLRQLGFSEKIIRRFFQPFFAGIFLEDDLATSSRMLEFVFKMFAEGEVTVPELGMEEIPKQLKANLKRTEFRFHAEVSSIDGSTIFLKDGEQLSCDSIIVATEANPIFPQINSEIQWKDSATYYFSGEKSPLHKNILALNYNSDRLVNHFCVISDVSKKYAPKGRSLMAVNLTHIPDGSVEEVSTDIRNELSRSFGPDVHQWELVANYHMQRALPQPGSCQHEMQLEESRVREGLYLAGDYLLNGSINAALSSGKTAAMAAILDYNANQT